MWVSLGPERGQCSKPQSVSWVSWESKEWLKYTAEKSQTNSLHVPCHSHLFDSPMNIYIQGWGGKIAKAGKSWKSNIILESSVALTTKKLKAPQTRMRTIWLFALFAFDNSLVLVSFPISYLVMALIDKYFCLNLNLSWSQKSRLSTTSFSMFLSMTLKCKDFPTMLQYLGGVLEEKRSWKVLPTVYWAAW